jgi:hypothetical protein
MPVIESPNCTLARDAIPGILASFDGSCGRVRRLLIDPVNSIRDGSPDQASEHTVRTTRRLDEQSCRHKRWSRCQRSIVGAFAGTRSTDIVAGAPQSGAPT